MPEKGELPKSFDSNLNLAREVVGRHIEFKPSIAFLEKQKVFHEQALKRAVDEKKVKYKENGDVLSLLVQAATEKGEGIKKPVDKESYCLNGDEQEAYLSTVDQCVDEPTATAEDKEALRITMTEVLFKSKVFRVHYEEWKRDYEKDSKLQEKFPTLESYVLERGKGFIRSRRNEIIASRLRKFQKDSLPGSDSEAQQKAEFKEIKQKTFQFIEKHEEELLQYSGLDEKDSKRQSLFAQFVSESGFQGGDLASAHILFEDIINDLEVGFTAEKKLEARNGRMVNFAQKSLDENKDLDDDEWNKMLDEEVKKNQFFKEVAAEHQNMAPQAKPQEIVIKSLNTPEDVAKEAGGLQIVRKEGDDYVLKYPDSDFFTTMRIIRNPKSKNLDDATFVFYDKYADKSKGDVLKVDRQHLRGGCNQIYLGYLMNDKIRQTDFKDIPNVTIRDVLSDANMVHMAERLFRKNLNEVALTQPIRETFTRFLEVIMKKDDTKTKYGNLGSFEARVKMMNTVLMRPEVAEMLYREFENAGSVSFTLSTLLDELDAKGMRIL